MGELPWRGEMFLQLTQSLRRISEPPTKRCLLRAIAEEDSLWLSGPSQKAEKHPKPFTDTWLVETGSICVVFRHVFFVAHTWSAWAIWSDQQSARGVERRGCSLLVDSSTGLKWTIFSFVVYS